MQTERFNRLRKKELEKVFDKKKMVAIWRTVVRDQLRTQDIRDLYDCYDLNFNIEERVLSVRSTILKGTYKASSPLIYRLEKRYGICRHMVIPQPIDALVLQTLTEAIVDDIISKQPSEKAFYSRARKNVKRIDDFDGYGMSIKQLWINLQKTIYKFTEEKKLIVLTDLSNYYDSINTNELQKVINHYTSTNEVVIDLLFGLIQEISWKPDYMPYSGRGIPTTSLEGVRLLAHSFLFEIDEVIKIKSSDCFTRWMDDIVIGVDTEKEAKEIISATSDMLKSRGLALNMAKTKIIDKFGAVYDFQFKENEYLTNVTKLAKELKVDDPSSEELADQVKVNFLKHLEDTKPKYWDKITKRYITFFSIIKSEKLLTEITDLYVDNPALRTNILMYLSSLGYRESTASIVLKTLKSLDIFDDISLYQICSLVTDWNIPNIEASDIFLAEFEKQVTKISFTNAKPSDFYSVIWFMSKYSSGKKLLDFVIHYENLWKSEPFLRRQVTAVLARLYIYEPEKVTKLLESLIASGDTSTVSLALQIMNFSKVNVISPRLNLYLFPKNKQRIYPHPKFLVLCSVMNSSMLVNNKSFREKVSSYIEDEFYQRILNEEYFNN